VDMRRQAAYPWTQVSVLDAADTDTRAVGRDGIDQVIQRDGTATNAAGGLGWVCRGIGTGQSGSLSRGVRIDGVQGPDELDEAPCALRHGRDGIIRKSPTRFPRRRLPAAACPR
jgi:hypothetical protein